ncbi:MAG: hypothetical protein V3S18_07705 [Dehalococcoidia bacterium]
MTETLPGGTKWSGEVQVFTLIDHPAASRAYAWPHPTPTDEGGVRYMAVLHEGPVDSAQAAVRAAIVAEQRDRE